MTVHDLPAVNASLNALAGACLFQGWRAIRAGKPDLHKRWMIAALACSAMFLLSYLTYHTLRQGMVTRYHGTGFSKIIYFFILITHTPLAALVVPLSLTAVWMAFKGRLKTHVKITRWLLPVWGYVSLTGVLIYLMLYVF